MIELTDREFIDAIEERFKTYGWRKGRIGTFDSCGCLLGAAGYVTHGRGLVTDKDGFNPISLDGKDIEEEGYDGVPGMKRLADMIGKDLVGVFVYFNDRFWSAEAVMTNLRSHLGFDKPE